MTWTDHWDPNPYFKNGLNPEKWFRSTHPSGYSIGEVDAGRYMATDDKDEVLCNESGECVFSTVEQAKKYVEQVIEAKSVL